MTSVLEPNTVAFADLLEDAITQMIAKGLVHGVMLTLAEQLLHLFANDSWLKRPVFHESRELSYIMSGVLAYLMLGSPKNQLQHESPEDIVRRLRQAIAALPQA